MAQQPPEDWLARYRGAKVYRNGRFQFWASILNLWRLTRRG